MAARKPHKQAHDPCPHGATTWGACEKAEKEARGRCTAVTEAGDDCKNWAADLFEERGYCGNHYASAVNRALKQRKMEAHQAALRVGIEEHQAFTREHPSVWCVRPAGWRPGDQVPDCQCQPANSEPVSRRELPRPRGRGRVLWSARSGSAPA